MSSTTSIGRLLFMIDDLVTTFTATECVSCANTACDNTVVISRYQHDKYRINDRNKVQKFALHCCKVGYIQYVCIDLTSSTTHTRRIEGIHVRHEKVNIHRDHAGENMDYYLSDDYSENGIVFCRNCVLYSLYPCFICHKLDIGGPGTDPEGCDFCINRQINHICRRDHFAFGDISKLQTERTAFKPRMFVCKYCLKIKLGAEFSHYLESEYGDDPEDSQSVGIYDDAAQHIDTKYSSGEEYEREPYPDGWMPSRREKALCNECAYRYLLEKKLAVTNAYIFACGCVGDDVYRRISRDVCILITMYFYPPNKMTQQQRQEEDDARQKAQELEAQEKRRKWALRNVWQGKVRKHVDNHDKNAIFCDTGFTETFLTLLVNGEDFPMKEDFDDAEEEWQKLSHLERIYLGENIRFWLSKYLVVRLYMGIMRLMRARKIMKWKPAWKAIDESANAGKKAGKGDRRELHERYRGIAAAQLFELIVKLTQTEVGVDGEEHDVNAIYDDVFALQRSCKSERNHSFQNEEYVLGARHAVDGDDERQYVHNAAPHVHEQQQESQQESSSEAALDLFSNTHIDTD